mmetsp:Transcript_30078/g.45259  ORF Transcript_30078/g.45259 Transcript_30078/m.45259 type:complete len:258 (+) Transcript_30078:45-818(+)
MLQCCSAQSSSADANKQRPMVTHVDWDFHQSAIALVKALNQSSDGNGSGASTLSSISSPVELASWVIEANGDRIYLAHPPVLVRSNDYNSHRIDNITSGEDKIEDSFGSDVDLDESTVHNCNPRYVTEWTFSVVFHETWRVPTLYFHVHDIDGSPITRDEVVSILLSSIGGNTTAISANGSMTEEQTWDFVSQEEHPMTGKPSFFLHPCQTAAKMELLLHQPKHICPLLSWMSMILPSVGCTISPSVYHEAHKNMIV